MASHYLPLAEYSMKHRVSISTLRRRIKSEDIQFTFEDGKYLILDEPVSTHQRVHRPSLTNRDESLMGAHTATTDFAAASAESVEEPVLTAAHRLLNELKKAYTQVLQEKEEQIILLKEEISDLKTLVRVLESQNEKTHNF